jgi:hypothetical protein
MFGAQISQAMYIPLQQWLRERASCCVTRTLLFPCVPSTLSGDASEFRETAVSKFMQLILQTVNRPGIWN